MNGYFAYTRVSTVKQGDGVSLEAQRDAISAYAQKNQLTVTEWFEEKETAAKRGRPVFNKIMRYLQAGQATGLIVHKIDRSARNFSDWAKVGELIDSGVDVRFAHESLDLRSRGGRLTADIQAVIAADYVRNLREECLKGIEGRLKQGLFPFGAPVGYLDQGAGRPKVPDPERAPYARQAFELYATERFSIRGLLKELQQRGFKSRSGRPITKGCLENLLNNPFYCGKIYLKRTERIYDGIHEPLVSTVLFDHVQQLKSGKQNKKQTTHNHAYRRLINCGHCGRSLYGESQKGHVYMRCQTKDCPTKTIRQEDLERAISAQLLSLQLLPKDVERLERELVKRLNRRTQQDDCRAIDLQLKNVSARLDRLTDALLDGILDQETYLERKERFFKEREQLQKMQTDRGQITSDEAIARQFLELAKSLYLSHQMADTHKRRRITEIAFSNLTLTGKNLVLEPQKWLSDADRTLDVLVGAPHRDRTRIEVEILEAVRQLKDNTVQVLSKQKRDPNGRFQSE